jgi:hypothetical protein
MYHFKYVAYLLSSVDSDVRSLLPGTCQISTQVPAIHTEVLFFTTVECLSSTFEEVATSTFPCQSPFVSISLSHSALSILRSWDSIIKSPVIDIISTMLFLLSDVIYILLYFIIRGFIEVVTIIFSSFSLKQINLWTMCIYTNSAPMWMLMEIHLFGYKILKFLCNIFGTILVADGTICTVVTSSV